MNAWVAPCFPAARTRGPRLVSWATQLGRPRDTSTSSKGLPPRLRLAVWLAAVGAGSNVPVPLFPLYQQRLGLSSSTVTALFGVYALGLLPALAVGGPAGDRWGERRVAFPASLAAVGVSAMLAASGGSLPMLMTARVLQGVVSGLVFTVGTAWLSSSPGRPGTGGRTAAVAMTAGFSLGALAGGVLGQWGPAPETVPYVLHALTVCAGVALIARVPASRGRPGEGAPASAATGALFRVGGAREALLVLAPSAVCVFGFPAIAINAVPVLVGVPGPTVIGTGVLAAVTLGTGTAVAPLQRVLCGWTAAVSAVCGALGFVLVTIAAAVPQARALVLPAAGLLGAGGGLALATGLVRLPHLAAHDRIATVSAAFYGFAYVGFGMPFLLAEIRPETKLVSPFVALTALSAALAVYQARVTRHSGRRLLDGCIELSAAGDRMLKMKM